MPAQSKPRPSLIESLNAPGNHLLSKQLASISATLASASKRRDTAVREVARRELSRPSTPTLAVQTPPEVPLADYQLSSTPMSEREVAIDHAALERPSVLKLTNGKFLSACDELKDMMQELDELSVQFKATSNLPIEDYGEKKSFDALLKEFEGMMSPPQGSPVPNLVVSEHLSKPNSVDEERKPELKISIPKEDGQNQGAQTPLDVSHHELALELEKIGVNLEALQDRSAYLFSKGPSGHNAVHEKYEFVRDATQELDALIEQTLKEESAYLKKKEQELIPCRLIVSNIAADADEEELALVFFDFKYDIRDIKMVSREPFSRVQSAHIDMYTRDAAERASYTVKAIYGLMLRVHLATDENSPSGRYYTLYPRN